MYHRNEYRQVYDYVKYILVAFCKHILLLLGIIRGLLYSGFKTRPYQTERLNDKHKRVWFGGSLEPSGRIHLRQNPIHKYGPRLGLSLEIIEDLKTLLYILFAYGKIKVPI